PLPSRPEPFPPFGKGARIILRKNAFPGENQTMIGTQLPKYGRRWQHPARKNVPLNEIGAHPIGIEHGLLDRDDLKSGSTVSVEAVADLREESGPVFLTNRFEHLD